MYFKQINLRNVGPIEKIDYDFSFNSNGNPKPVILVGTNGSGKSILLSYLLNPLMAAQQIAFDDAEVEQGRVYKLRSPQYIKNGEKFSYARINFGQDFNCYEWQLCIPKEEYIKQFGEPEVDSSFEEIPLHETSFFNVTFLNNAVEISQQFRKNCVLYFPANRFEQPAWLNERNLNAIAEFVAQQKIDRISNRRIIQQSPLTLSKNWILDIAFDRANYELQLSNINVPIIGLNTPTDTNNPCRIYFNPFYKGKSSRLWEAMSNIIKLIFRSDESFCFEIGLRQNRTISVLKNGKPFIPNIFQLSTGQTSILNIVLSILRDFDMSGAPFENLEDISGIVIIDEVDAHLHAELQSNVLPAIIAMFPKVQFILTTHSPLFLLGMKNIFGDTGFDILSLPTGLKVNTEEFEEFKSAFDFYKSSSVFRHKIEYEVNQTRKPVIFVEGDYDIKYLNKAALLFGKQSILDQIFLYDGDGQGNLSNIWRILCKDAKRLAIALPKVVGLIYDCDTNQKNEDNSMAKKRVIPTMPDNPIPKGIENLFPTSTINNLRKLNPQFFDITPEITKTVRGVSEKQAEICEINKSEKRNMCDWLCINGTVEDFVNFKFVFTLIEDIAELNNVS
ncbi:AAA family ATPase [Nostoc sp. FACHB-87]|uniref:AAA family ATPase n=1 Tax=Nostocaceae TaxID=1162 RepID=UPI001689BF7B|nr:MULTISPECIES: AAA family ATPase [Nostocaceae]MBD2457713.1 AAA family ATPase [Nostoc sp. FACHB-87]MBD2478824.1 AAA family ATPase [Anabaena sp. FACHB-83]